MNRSPCDLRSDRRGILIASFCFVHCVAGPRANRGVSSHVWPVLLELSRPVDCVEGLWEPFPYENRVARSCTVEATRVVALRAWNGAPGNHGWPILARHRSQIQHFLMDGHKVAMGGVESYGQL